MSIETVSRDRIHPHLPQNGRRVVPLSILENTVARFPPASGVWFYDQPLVPGGKVALSAEHLIASLPVTLSAYPHWAGQLEYAPYSADNSGGHTQRYARLQVVYGDPSADPGVEVAIARHPLTLASYVPSQEERSTMGSWNADRVREIALLLTSPPMALADMVTSEGLPSVIIQITTFSCGGVAIAIKIFHSLADATSIVQFMRDWANTNKNTVDGISPPLVTPLFDPAALDRAAAGDIDAPAPDPAIMERARKLPLHRYDWWASGTPSCPPFMVDGTVVPSLFEAACQASEKGPPLPWSEWDYTKPVEHQVVYFSPGELQGMWEQSSSTTVKLSKLDALVAHIWGIIVSARGQADDDTPVHLDMTMGLRTRLMPPLPVNTLGAPIVIIPITLPAREVASSHVHVASSLRSSIALYDAPSLAAHLHDAAFYLSPHRYWNAILGERHTFVTSWLRLGVYDVDFGGGQAPRYVQALVPEGDGCVSVMEAPSLDGGTGRTENKWYDSGVAVSLYLPVLVSQRVIANADLRRFK